MGLSETWLSPLCPEAIITMSGYNTFRKDQLEGKGGGVLLYVKSHLKCHQLELPTEIQLECIGVNITLSASMSFIVICIYRKPTSKVDFYDQLKMLCNFCDHKTEFILVGDFNINWDKKEDRRNLKTITDKFSLTQFIDKPTRITNQSQTKIDLLFTNRPERIIKPFLTGISDHNAVFFCRKLSKK